MLNPDYGKIAAAYGIRYRSVEDRAGLEPAVREMFSDDAPCLLDVRVMEEDNVMPMVPPGRSVGEMMLTEKEWYRK